MCRAEPDMVINFGGNLSFAPKSTFTPRTEHELLELLGKNRGRRIRAVGQLHSWSDAPIADDVLLDLRRMNEIQVSHKNGKYWVTVGAGCQIKRLLIELDRQHAGTLPALGLI